METDNNNDVVTQDEQGIYDLREYGRHIGVALAIAPLVFVWAYFHAVDKVPWPDDRVPKTAGEIAQKQKTTYVRLDPNIVRQQIGVVALLAMTNEQRVGVNSEGLLNTLAQTGASEFTEQVIVHLSAKWRGKNVLVETSGPLGLDPGFNQAAMGLYKLLDDQIAKIRAATGDEWTQKNQIKTLQEKRALYDVIYKRCQAIQIQGTVNLYEGTGIQPPNAGSPILPWSFVATSVSGFYFDRSRENVSGEGTGPWLLIARGEQFPVVSDDFFDVAGDAVESYYDTNEDRIDPLLAKDNAVFEQAVDHVTSEIDRQVAQAREAARTRFYEIAFPRYLLLLMSLLVLLVMQRFWNVLQRGLKTPKKSTHDIYYATNMTALEMRRTARYVVAFFGFLLLLVDAWCMTEDGAMASMQVSTRFMAAFFGPPAVLIITLIISWWYLLVGEFYCYLSHRYHNAYMRAHHSHQSDSETE